MLLKDWGPTWEAAICLVCSTTGWGNPASQNKHPLGTRHPSLSWGRWRRNTAWRPLTAGNPITRSLDGSGLYMNLGYNPEDNYPYLA